MQPIEHSLGNESAWKRWVRHDILCAGEHYQTVFTTALSCVVFLSSAARFNFEMQLGIQEGNVKLKGIQ